MEGIRKINEYVLKPGRALIVTDSLINIEDLPSGSLFVSPATGDFRYKSEDSSEYRPFLPQNIFQPKTISKAFITDETLTDVQIQKNTITNECLKNKTVNTDKIKDNAVLSRLIAPENVTTSHLATKSVTDIKLADNAVAERVIKDASITNRKLATDSVYGSVIKNGSINAETKIEAGTIVGHNIKNYNIAEHHLSSYCLYERHFTTNCIASGSIQNGAIVTSKIAYGAVTESTLSNFSVTNTKLATWSVTTDKIVDGTIVNSKIAVETIENNRIRTGTLGMDRLSPVVQKAINSSIKLSDNGIATVGGSLSVTGNATVRGDISANRVFNAVYNDLAEGYVPGEALSPGDIVEIREDEKVYKCSLISHTIVGVVSNEYAQCFGASEKELRAGTKVPVALIGKVHTKIKGPIKQGDYVMSYFDGVGAGSSTSGRGVVGRALESRTDIGVHKVLCLIFPS